MAPEAANQKRKRGRPPANASQAGAGAPQTQLKLTKRGAIDRPQATNQSDDAADEDSRPRKRGRPARVEAPPPEEPPVPEAPAPSEEQPSKRKRGRQPLSRQSELEPEPESEQPVEKEAAATAQSASTGRKRRPAASLQSDEVAEDTNENPITAAVDKRPKTRGRPSLQRHQIAEDTNDNSATAAASKLPRKRGKPSLQKKPEDGSKDSSAADIDKLPKKGRPSKAARAAKENEVRAGEADDENEGSSSLLRRSTRQRQSLVEQRPAKEQAETGAASRHPEDSSRPAKGKGGRRPSPADNSSPEAQEAQGNERPNPKKRGRPTVSEDIPDAASDEQGKKRQSKPQKDVEATRKKRGPRKQSVEQPGDDEEENEPSPEAAPTRKGRRRTSDPAGKSRRRAPPDEQPSRSPSPDPAPYRQITTRTRRVPRHVIEKKWSPLDAASVDNVTNLLHSASRPVLLRLNNARKHAQATAALNAISNRLRAKLTRGLPFPPATTSHRQEDELEFERTVDGIHSLEAQLDPLLHSVALLEKEKARAEKDLEQEYRLLNTLSANARSEARGRRDQLRKTHVLVPEPNKYDDSHPADDEDEFIGELRPVEKSAGKTFVDLENDELKDLAGQLANHMESMRGNLQQIEGIVPAMAETRAALRLALLPRLDQELLDQVLFG